ncbi:MAG: exonuclease [Planctomycetota bacterium]|nr:MAG: exonuclease [Planctomycetota bacterium]
MENLEFAIVDLETTGGNFIEDRIIEVAVVIFSPRQGIMHHFSSLVNPQKEIPVMIQRLTGIKPKDVKGAPTFDKVAQKVWELTENRIFVAHNVSFDYRFLKNEYLRLCQNFSRRKICTIKLAKKVVSNVASYGLDKICSFFQIPIQNRHRALGDAMATAELLEKLLQEDKEGVAEELISEGLYDWMLPPSLTRKDIDSLPEETGIYFLLDGQNRPLYIGKSKNIRSRIIQHFRESEKKAWLRKVEKIETRLTGSELVALLWESLEIKEGQPLYNKRHRNVFMDFGLQSFIDSQGYIRLKIISLQNNSSSYWIGFSTQKEGKGFLQGWTKRFGLCPTLCGLSDSAPCFAHQVEKCKGACIGKESPQKYNRRVKQALHSLSLPYSDFLVFDKGRTLEEESIVLVQNRAIQGFGYIPRNTKIKDMTEVENRITKIEVPHQDYLFILLKYLKKKNRKIQIFKE